MSGFSNSIVGGMSKLIRAAIQSPNYQTGVAGWSINKDGTAQFNQLSLIVQTSGAAVLVYAGTAQAGTLVGAWSNTAGTDSYGNSYPGGLYVLNGFLSGVYVTTATLVACTLLNAVLQGPSITNAAIQSGTITESVITFDQQGGGLFVYSSSSTTITLTSGTSMTAPAGNYTQGKVEVWGGGAGADGSTATLGGITGGSAEYACEPSYPLIPGAVYNYQIGVGGSGAANNNYGYDGTQSAFDNQGVVANPGLAAAGNPVGTGGTGSTATIVRAGTDGTLATTTSGAGGPGSPGATGAGGSGAAILTAGAAGTGGGAAGGAGAVAAANGSNGVAPGSAGGGAGAASGSTQGFKQYRFTASGSYYGSDATGTPNGYKGSGTMFQGGETASGGSSNGTMKSLGILPASVQSDLSGVTIDSVSLRMEWLHTWYNSGAYMILGYTNFTGFGGTWNGSGITPVKTFWQGNVGSPHTQDLTNTGLGAALQSGAAKSLSFGPGSPGFDLYNYGYLYGAGGDNSQNPLLTVNYHTGAAPTTSGNGTNGQIKITYVSSSVIVSAISPVAGTDSRGNGFAAGYTGDITAFHPGSSPAVAETWQTVPLASGWSVRTGGAGTGYKARYQKTSDRHVELDIEVTNAGTSGTSVLSTALNSNYWPASPQDSVIGWSSTGAPTSSPAVQLSTVGVLTLFNLPASTTLVQIKCRLPLD